MCNTLNREVIPVKRALLLLLVVFAVLNVAVAARRPAPEQ